MNSSVSHDESKYYFREFSTLIKQKIWSGNNENLIKFKII